MTQEEAARQAWAEHATQRAEKSCNGDFPVNRMREVDVHYTKMDFLEGIESFQAALKKEIEIRRIETASRFNIDSSRYRAAIAEIDFFSELLTTVKPTK